MIAELQSSIGARRARPAFEANLTSADKLKIKVERRAHLLRGAPVAIAISALNAVITFFVARADIERTILVGWVGAVLTLCFFRFLIWLRFRKQAKHGHALIRYTKYHVGGMALNGVLWGMLAPIFAFSDLLGHAFLPFIVAGMTAAAVSSAGSSWKSVLSFNIPVLASLAVSYALFIEPGGYAIAAIVVIYGVATSFLAWSMQQMIERSIRLRSRNDTLLQALTQQIDYTHEAAQRFRALIEASSDVTLIFSPEGKVIYASPSVEKTLQTPPQLLIGCSTKDVVHPDDLPLFQSAGGKALAKIGEATAIAHLCLRNSADGYQAFSGRLTNMLYVPGVEGFVFVGALIDENGCADHAHAAE